MNNGYPPLTSNAAKDISWYDQIPPELDMADKYALILIENGTLTLSDGNKPFVFTGPGTVSLKENKKWNLVSSRKLVCQVIVFHIKFLNICLNYHLINSGRYKQMSPLFGDIPLEIFYEHNETYHGFLPLQPNSYHSLHNRFKALHDVLQDKSDERWSCKARLELNHILEILYQNYRSFLDTDKPICEIKRPDTWFPIVLEFIHSNFYKSISLKSVAQYININKTTLSQQFKDRTGVGVTEYIIHYRIRCACHSLATTNLTIQEIASACGFTDPSYFAKQFKKQTGMSPMQYRHSCISSRNKEAP